MDRTTEWYAAADPNRSLGPAEGHRSHNWERYDAYPVSFPFEKGELAERASTIGSQTRIRSRTATPSSSDSTLTWTWEPQVSTSWTTGPNRSIIRRYRGLGVL